MPSRPTTPAAPVTQAIARMTHAAHFAARAHKAQQRKGIDAEPYVNHLLEVAELVAHAEVPGDIEVVIAALLHDTIEDVGVTEAQLVAEFGPRVAALVMAVTDDKTLPRDTRKWMQIHHAPTLSHDAKLIKLADKISNLRALMRTPPVGWTQARLHDYVVWAKAVVDACGPVDPGLERLFTEAHAVAATTFGRIDGERDEIP